MENIRYLLSQFNSHTSLYIGNKYATSRVVEVGWSKNVNIKQRKWRGIANTFFILSAILKVANFTYLLFRVTWLVAVTY